MNRSHASFNAKSRRCGIEKRCASTKAWTLIELLTTLSILAVLLALSYSAIGEFRKRLDKTECINNLHLLAGSALRFAQDHNGLMPSADWQTNGNRKSAAGDAYAVQGSLIPYLADWKIPGSPSPTTVARCPADNRAHNGNSDWQTYCLNSYAKGVKETTSGGVAVLAATAVYSGRLQNIPSPGGMAMFMDGVKPFVGAGGHVTYPATIGVATFTIKDDTFYVHQKHINIVYMDGHVGSMTQQEMRAHAREADVFWTGGMTLP